MYVSHGYASEPWLIPLRQQTFIHQPDTSGSSTSHPSSNQKFEKTRKISHLAIGSSGTTPSPSLSRPAVSRNDKRTPCRNNCGQTFALAGDAKRHYNSSCLLSYNLTRAHCPMCSKSFSRKDSLRRHVVDKHRNLLTRRH